MDEKTIKERLRLVKYIIPDGEVSDVKKIAKSLKNLGDLPRFFTIDELKKAFADMPAALDLLEKQRNIANLTPVKRQIVNKNGVAYVKTVYVKKVDDDEKATAFLKQDEYEKEMQVGDIIDASFKGWSTNNIYKTKGKLQISKINDDHIVAKFIEPFETHNRNNHTYPVGYEVKLPRTNSGEWNKNMSFHKHEPEPQQKQSSGLTKVESISEISVGDVVTIKTRSEEKIATIRYIHPRGEWLELVTSDGKRTRRKLSSIYKGQSEPENQPPMSWERKRELERKYNVIMYVTGTSNLSEYSGTIEEKRKKAYDERLRDIKFDEKFGKMNFDKLIPETQALLKESFGDIETSFEITTGKNEYGDTHISFEIDNDKVRIVRQFVANERSGEMEVHHQYFKIKDDDFKGKGFGKKLFRIWYEQYKNVGVDRIDVYANIDLGGYVWMRYGFMATKSTAQRFASLFERSKNETLGTPYVGDYTITEQDARQAKDIVEQFYNEHSGSTLFPMRLLSTIGPNKLASKVIMYQKSWNGTLNLNNDEQRTYFENYIGFSR